MGMTEHREHEIEHLARIYGPPEMIECLLPTGMFDPMAKRRDGEIVAAIIRPNGKLILITKAFYPEGTYRLPSGGIEAGESIEDALHREVYEETSLEVEVIEYVAIVKYTAETFPHQFTSHVFLLKEIGGNLACVDQEEQISGYKEIDFEELADVITQLENIEGELSEWGLFRAIPHKAVLSALRTGIC